ncbi:MAG: glycosyltransferase family 4 protein [Solirubrobacterales bacterium]|nr:glycosyltransferase family 4 protein [Solirubrobacterales bacterium]
MSAQTYAAVNTLGAHAYDVDVVTNAREAEPELRELMLPEDEERLLDGPARVHYTTPLADDSYVPWANPYASKLLGLTLSVVERERSDAIVGWYLEPYGLVASFAGRITGRPVMLIHAGSDLGRLALHEDLSPAYRWCIASADRIQTHPLLIPRLLALGASQEQLVFPRGSRPPGYFRAEAPSLDVERYVSVSPDWAFAASRDAARFDPALPTIGVYGKVNRAKGSFDLLAALTRLASEEAEFTFLAAIGGDRQSCARFVELVRNDDALRRRTTLLPFLPPWRIPELLAACDMVCCLERRFPISFHNSSIPFEAATCGACLLCSREVIAPHAREGVFVGGETCIEVADPEDHDELTRALRWAIANRSAVREIGRRAHSRELELQERAASDGGVAGAIEGWLASAVG